LPPLLAGATYLAITGLFLAQLGRSRVSGSRLTESEPLST